MKKKMNRSVNQATRKSRSALMFGIAAAAALGAVQQSQAATLYWDGTDSTANADGGAGAWNAANAWDTANTGGSNVTWNSATPDVAVFGGTASALVTTGAAITTGGIQFNTTGYTITADATNTLSFNGTSNILFNNVTAATATITGTVGGSGNVVLSTASPSAGGTLTLNGTSTGGWSGTTTINAGTTLSLSGLNQGLVSTTGITLNGGGITLTNANSDAERILDRVSNSAAITSNGGTITYTTTTANSTRVFAETIGSVDLVRGQANFVNTLDKSQGSQTLTLSGLTRTGASNTSAVTFSNTGGLNTTNDRIAVTGAGTTAGWTDAAASNSILGPWATVGTTAALQTDYAVYSGGYVIGANTAGSLQGTWTDSTKQYTSNTSAVALSGNLTMNALRNTAATATITLSDGAAGYTLATNGILNGVGTLLTIAPGTPAGSLTAPGVSGGNIFLNAGSGNITVSAPINNNGGNVTVVKNGAATLTLSSTTSNYSGGTVINAGTLTITSDSNLGATSGGITFDGSATLNASGVTIGATRTITLNNGAIATFSGVAAIVGGAVTGTGGILKNNGSNNTLIFSNANNHFTGPVLSSVSGALSFASLSDAVGAGVISMGNNANQNTAFTWTGGAKTFSNRQFLLSSSGANSVTLRNDGTGSLTINTDLGVPVAGQNKTLILGGSYTGGTNTIAGKITDPSGAALTIQKNTDASLWTLSGAGNTFTGAIEFLGTASSGSTLSYASAGGTNPITFNQTTGSATLSYIGSGQTMSGAITASALTTGTITLDASGLGAVNYSNAASLGSAASGNKNLVLSGTNTGDNTFAGQWVNNTSGNATLTKSGDGMWILTGNNTYTGNTIVSAGTLLINGSTSSTSLVTVGVNGTLGGTGTVGGNTTISGTHSPGNSPGIQTFTGNLSYVDAGTPDPSVSWELASNTTTVGVNPTAAFDQVIVGGNLAFTNTTTINLSFNGAGSTVLWANALWDANQSWILYDVAGTTTNFANLNLATIGWLDSGGNLFSTTGGSFTLGQSGQDVVLNYAVIPEPNVAALLGTLGTLLLLRRRRS